MVVYLAKFNAGETSGIVGAFASREGARKYIEEATAYLYPSSHYEWRGNCYASDDRYEEYNIMILSVKE